MLVTDPCMEKKTLPCIERCFFALNFPHPLCFPLPFFFFHVIPRLLVIPVQLSILRDNSTTPLTTLFCVTSVHRHS